MTASHARWYRSTQPRHLLLRVLIFGGIGVALALLLTGCGDGPKNTDPRKGRVVTDEEGCFTGGCFSDWKACAGPDLIVHLAGNDHTVKDSPECAQDGGQADG